MTPFRVPDGRISGKFVVLYIVLPVQAVLAVLAVAYFMDWI